MRCNQKIKTRYILKANEMQLPLEKSKIELILKEIEEIENEQELKEFLDTLELSELLEIYYIQLCEISRIRNVILDSFKDKDI